MVKNPWKATDPNIKITTKSGRHRATGMYNCRDQYFTAYLMDIWGLAGLYYQFVAKIHVQMNILNT